MAALFVCAAVTLALPGDDEIAEEIEAFLNGTAKVGACATPEHQKPHKQ